MANDLQKRSALDQLTDAATAPSVPAPSVLVPPQGDSTASATPPLADASSSVPGSIANLESAASSPDTRAADIQATKAEKPPSFLSKLKNFAGGALGVENPDSSSAASAGAKTMGVLGRLGNALALSEGTPEQKQIAEENVQLPLKMAQIQNEQQYRQGLIGSRNVANDIKQQQADQQKTAADAKMRLKGYMPDENAPGTYRAMNEDEILTDPILSKNQDLAAAAVASKNASATLSKARADALLNPNNPTLQLKAKQIENTYKLAQAHLGMQMQNLARQNQEFLYNYGQSPGTTAGQPGAAGNAPGSAGGLNLGNAPDMMIVNPATGLPIPNKMLPTLKPTQQEQNRADFASSAIHSADKIAQLIASAKAQIGPFDGRVADLMARAGLGDQFNQELQNYVRFTQSAATAAHTGRFSVPILDKMDKMIGPEMNPDQMAGALESIKGQMAPYADAGWKPTVWEYRSWLNGSGTTPSGKTAKNATPPSAPPATPTKKSFAEWKQEQQAGGR